MKEELIDCLREFIDLKYTMAGDITGTYGNWSGNREIVDKSTLEEFLLFLENRQ